VKGNAHRSKAQLVQGRDPTGRLDHEMVQTSCKKQCCKLNANNKGSQDPSSILSIYEAKCEQIGPQ